MNEELKKFLEANKDSDEVRTLIQGLFPTTVESIQKFVTENEDARKWIDSEKDKHSGKALETWKKNNLNSLVDNEVKKRFPEADPKDVKIKELEATLEAERKAIQREQITNKALKHAENKLPKEMIDFLIGEDEEKTLQNIDSIQKVIDSHIATQVETRLKDGAYVPAGNAGSNNTPVGLDNAIASYYSGK